MAITRQKLPTQFSWREKGKDMIENGRNINRDQRNCGCCWAMALVSALGDRYAIKYGIKSPYPSTLSLVSCGGTEVGKGGINSQKQCICGGSYIIGSKWLEKNYISSESCWPFLAGFSSSKFIMSSRKLVAPECSYFVNNNNCCIDCCNNPLAKKKIQSKKKIQQKV